MNRRRFLTSAVGVGAVTLGTPWLAAAGAATDDDLAFAYFGLSAELLLADFYAKGVKSAPKEQSSTFRQGATTAKQHAKALSDLLAGAGVDVPAPADFDFQWPKKLFADSSKTLATGITIHSAAQGAYQTGAATSSEPTYRVLFASLAASNAQQVGVVRALAGLPAAEPFPVALDLEAASDSIETYLG